MFISYLQSFLQNFWQILLESSPWLLLGFTIASVIKILVPMEFLHRHLGGNNVSSVVKGALIGAPLPLCSCGVIPATLGLRRAGASKSATTSFLIATPETGVDSVSVTYALLGSTMAIIRPISALVTAISAGLLVLLTESMDDKTDNKSQPQSAEISSCCSKEPIVEEKSCCSTSTAIKVEEKSSCCSSSSCCESSQNHNNLANNKIISNMIDMYHAINELVADTAQWLLIGLAIASVIMTFVPSSLLSQWGSSPYAYILMALVGVPMYICATASTPIASGLLSIGVAPGAILVFLLVGPATNMATLAIVKQELGTRVLVCYLGTVVTVSFICAWVTDSVITSLDITMPTISHSMQPSIFATVCSLVLIFLIGQALVKK